MKYRQATAQDAAAIAVPHADSWRRHYRGACLDSYLDGDVTADRMAEWTDRLSQARADWHTLIAESGDAVAGFAHVILDADPIWGAYVDALHVRHDMKRQGLGVRLIAETARWVARSRSSSGIYLWVLEQNSAAQAFYTAQGGSNVERQLAGPFPGGGRAYSFRYAWPDLSRLTSSE